MSEFLTVDGVFVFPDFLFPLVEAPFPGLPISPQEKIHKLQTEYKNHAQNAPTRDINGNTLFRWARETLDFAECQPGLDIELVDTAVDVIKLIAASSSSKFNGPANYLMGLWYLFGLFGAQADHKLALDKFLVSAKMGYSRALYRLGASYEAAGQLDSALAYFKHGTKRGDAACYYRMAIAHLRGQLGLTVDGAKGLTYLERSSVTSDPDCAQASYIYGLVLLGEIQMVDVATDKQKGILAIERSAWLGFGPALLRMGKEWQGAEKGYDAAVALRYFHLASRQDQYGRFKGTNSPAGMLLGVPEVEISKWMLCGSEGLFEANEEWAFRFSSLAADQGNGMGEYALGYFYEVGIHVEGDLEMALKWYAASGEHECEDGRARLAQLQEAQQSNGEVRRRLTRKDHERTLSVRGRAKIKSSRTSPANSQDMTHMAPVVEAIIEESQHVVPTEPPSPHGQSVSNGSNVTITIAGKPIGPPPPRIGAPPRRNHKHTSSMDVAPVTDPTVANNIRNVSYPVSSSEMVLQSPSSVSSEGPRESSPMKLDEAPSPRTTQSIAKLMKATFRLSTKPKEKKTPKLRPTDLPATVMEPVKELSDVNLRRDSFKFTTDITNSTSLPPPTPDLENNIIHAIASSSPPLRDAASTTSFTRVSYSAHPQPQTAELGSEMVNYEIGSMVDGGLQSPSQNGRPNPTYKQPARSQSPLLTPPLTGDRSVRHYSSQPSLLGAKPVRSDSPLIPGDLRSPQSPPERPNSFGTYFPLHNPSRRGSLGRPESPRSMSPASFSSPLASPTGMHNLPPPPERAYANSVFSRASTVSSMTSASTSVSAEPEILPKVAEVPIAHQSKVALTFDAMGVPVKKETKDDCVVM
jgi:TPR repeat protein